MNKLFTPKRLVGLLLLLTIVSSAVLSAAVPDPKIRYQVITDYGKIEDLQKKVQKGSILQESHDGKNVYILKEIAIESEDQLIRAMGGSEDQENPETGEAIARIINFQTHSKLSDQEMRKLLGSNSGVESFLRSRSGNRVTPPPQNSGQVSIQPVPPRPSTKRYYKWVDSNGQMHFSDSPPPPGVKYEMRSPEKPTLRDQGSNPFFD